MSPSKRLLRTLLPFAGCLGLLAASPETTHLRVIPLDASGAIPQDIKLQDWKATIGGKAVQIVSQRTPQELQKESQQWVFVFLPIRGADARRLALQGVASFMQSLPATDSALVVLRTEKGLECLTPGFTTRPSLWAQALRRVLQDLPARLPGDAGPAFVLPPAPAKEAEEGMEPIQKFTKDLAGMEMPKHAEDARSARKSIMDDYDPPALPGVTRMVAETLVSLEKVGETLAKAPGAKQIVVLGWNQMDDLANPVWARSIHAVTFSNDDPRRSSETFNDDPKRGGFRLFVETMIRDVTLARESLKHHYTALGLTLHSVGGAGEVFGGCLAEAASASGGFSFRFGPQFVPQFSQVLTQWSMGYEVTATMPEGAPHPCPVDLDTSRKGLRLYAPHFR